MAEVLPNFLLVGAVKAGTTSLWAWLSQHPEVFMPASKEAAYFVHCGMRTPTREAYVALFEGAEGKKAVGEASAAYLSAPESPGRIAEALGSPRIIIMVRDPVKRAFSHYRFNCMNGREPIRRFENALRAEEQRSRNIWFRATVPDRFMDFMYFRSGLYYEQIQRFVRQFGRDRVGVFLFDDMVHAPVDFFRDVCSFLEISRTFVPSDMAPRNPGVFPRFRRLHFLAGELERFACTHKWHRQTVCRWVGGIQNLNRRLGSPGTLDPATEEMLRERYRDEIHRLSSFLGRDLSAWCGENARPLEPSDAVVEDTGDV